MIEARSFFEDEVLSTMPSQPGPEGNKTPLWDQAKMVKISLGDALVVPIKYEKPQGIKAEGEKTFRDLQKSSYLLIYKDKNKNMQAEWVSLAPMGEKKNDKFVGIISVHEWNGKPKHAFAFNQNGNIALMQETNVFFRKASMRNSVLCYKVDYTYVDIRRDENGLYDVEVIGYTRTNCITIDDYNEPNYEDFEYNFGAVSGYNGIGPYEYSDKIDCAGFPGGTAIFSTECQQCIGGKTGIDKCPTDSLKKIMKPKNDCLTDPQNTMLNNTFNQYLYEGNNEYWKCLRNFIYKKIESSGIKIGVCLDPTITDNGAYRPSQKNILLPNEFTLSSSSLFGHEFFHVYQDAHYPGGTSQYSYTGNPNLEFEQALFKDIINGGFPTSAMGNGVSTQLQDEYETWIKSITNNFTIKPLQFSDLKGKYNYFLEQFYQNGPYNRRGAINYNLRPDALFSIFTNSNCNFEH
ncbi:hypothetical protein [Daejeonella sp.]|uniref:hypothetical protein n=1 Tax=Daejeonella sp. TaxID=2805397 RepID=UPI0025C0D444|nr:hypothetical protein [Daejeonella sp.]